MHSAFDPGNRAERRRKVQVVGPEIAGAGDRLLVPGNSPATADRAVDQRDDPLGQSRQFFGLQALAEANSGNVEDRIADPAGQAMPDNNIGNPGPARRMLERADGADHVIGQRETDIVAAQRIETRLLGAIGHRQRAIHCEIPLVHTPATRCVAEQQRDLANGPSSAGEGAVDPAPVERPANFIRVEQQRGFILPEPHRQCCGAEAVTADQPGVGGSDRDR